MKKPLKFSINKLIINNTFFDMNSLQNINNDLEKHEVSHRNSAGSEILSIKKVERETMDGRFVTICFLEGGKFPYSDMVIDTKLNEHGNPRSPEEIELDNQFFVLIDTTSQKIYLSDQRRKNTLCEWLIKKINKNVEIKSIINEQEFIDNIKSISGISFAAAPGLFNSQNEDILSNKLIEDIYGFDAESMEVKLSYSNSKITDKIIAKLKLLIGRKNEFKNITVIGRNDHNFESMFNIDEVINRITIEADVDDKTELFEHKSVFKLLIDKITGDENKKTN